MHVLFTVLVLMCRAALDHSECEAHTAEKVYYLPERAGNEVMCGLWGQMYAAQLNGARTKDEVGIYYKVTCQWTTISIGGVVG